MKYLYSKWTVILAGQQFRNYNRLSSDRKRNPVIQNKHTNREFQVNNSMEKSP
jgi:hypothetical protein